MFLLVDAHSLVADPELSYLLSFAGVEGITVEHHVTFVERPGHASAAVVGEAGTHLVGIAPFHQLRHFAREITARPDCAFTQDVVGRALHFAFLARRLGADAVVTPARPAFCPDDRRLLDNAALLTVAEALALIGAHVRQREVVPLGGSPPLVQQRTEVYPLTARVVIPSGQDWWSACVYTANSRGPGWLSYAEAVFKRIGQALRGRDGVHEALRVGAGRAAILNALYHFDVVLTSGVGALDAAARVAHEAFLATDPTLKLKAKDIAWQNQAWTGPLKVKAPAVAAVVDPATPLGAARRVLAITRNSIHNVPLDEYLHIGAARAEHRVTLAPDLARELRDVGAPLAPLDRYGLHLDDPGTPFLNVGQFTECLLAWTVAIAGELLRAMLAHPEFGAESIPPLQLQPLALHERQCCAVLARVGTYPYQPEVAGVPASPSVHRAVMASLHEATRSDKRGNHH